ncbi:MAG TPA: aminomethyl-transferring glycine dehydrogenase subunit GcvPB [Terriglobia bacterium]|nr:aminomethyl-transferring glycine dehydrogenase subunit GcvPB [Terriglobia bacterium]
MNDRIQSARPHMTRNEDLIFERSTPGKGGADMPPLDVTPVPPREALGNEFFRDDIEGFPEVSELDVVRHFTRLSTWNYSIDAGVYPLGSCTMKYNPRLNEAVARFKGLGSDHPYTPEHLAQGCLRVLAETMRALEEITGMDAVSLQPAAGAQGELTGLLMIRSCLRDRGDPRRYVLIPDSAHGTNPASVVTAGYQVRPLKSDRRGCVDQGELEREMTADVAGLMLTNPNTLGIFETDIRKVCEIVHSAGGLVYMDGANMNALVGVARPGDFGVDVMHLNLHKTFSTPHGGGGPGSGPVATKQFLEPYLPAPVVEEAPGGGFRLNYDRPQSVGRVRAFYGNFGMAVRALAYILAYGPAGARQATEDAVLNANYIKARLRDLYDLPYDSPSLHECVFSDRRQAARGVRTGDIAKRLIDYGFHPYTVSFPLIVPGALMIEPTESAGLHELDAFIEAMRSIAQESEETPELVQKAPHTTRVSRLDEAAAARRPVLRWKPSQASSGAGSTTPRT